LRGVQFLLVPIHTGTHYFLGVVNFVAESFLIWDSLRGYDVYHERAWMNMKLYMKIEFGIDATDWPFVVVRDAARQPNTCDCGVYMCANMKAYALQLDPRVCLVGETMASFRLRMLSELAVHIEQFFKICGTCNGIDGRFARDGIPNPIAFCRCESRARNIIVIH
jgi:Ulp1 family protease